MERVSRVKQGTGTVGGRRRHAGDHAVPRVLYTLVAPKALREAVRSGSLRAAKGERLRLTTSAPDAEQDELLLRVDASVAVRRGVSFERDGAGEFSTARIPLVCVGCPSLPPSAGKLPCVRAAGGILVREGAEPLVCVLRKRRQRGARWVLPKGKRRPSESLVETARREVAEETGLVGFEVGPVVHDETYFSEARGRVVVKRVTYFLMLCSDDSASLRVCRSEGFTAGRWVSFDEALELTAPSRAHDALDRARTLLASDEGVRRCA
jgi:8-oxo-dGTP pyrophosphatase MutT (NUDIX family)